MNGWSGLVSAAFSGGVAVKILDYAVAWLKESRHAKKTAKAVVDAHLAPLLRAADEIVGKTRSLAERDFKPLLHAKGYGAQQNINPDLMGLLYLYAKFWSRLEILEHDSIGVSIATDKRGVKLKSFLACLESQRIRLVDRVHQKAISEITTQLLDDGTLRTIGVVEFTNRVLTDQTVKAWIKPLYDLLMSLHIKARRQRLLVYGVVVHTLVDALDPEHQSTHPKPTYPHKLTKKAKRDIRYRAFGVYLNKIASCDRYIQQA